MHGAVQDLDTLRFGERRFIPAECQLWLLQIRTVHLGILLVLFILYET